MWSSRRISTPTTPIPTAANSPPAAAASGTSSSPRWCSWRRRPRTLRLVTSVMVVPHRPALLTAKILSTIDVLSGGRLTLGIGAGWLQEEFEALQVARLRRPRQGDGRIPPGRRGALDRAGAALRRRICPLPGHQLPAEAGAARRPAGLGRRRERPGAAPHRAPWRCLVPDRHQPLLPAGKPGALPRRRSRSCAGWWRRRAATRPRSRWPTACQQYGRRCRPRPATASGGCSPAGPTRSPTT